MFSVFSLPWGINHGHLWTRMWKKQVNSFLQVCSSFLWGGRSSSLKWHNVVTWWRRSSFCPFDGFIKIDGSPPFNLSSSYCVLCFPSNFQKPASHPVFSGPPSWRGKQLKMNEWMMVIVNQNTVWFYFLDFNRFSSSLVLQDRPLDTLVCVVNKCGHQLSQGKKANLTWQVTNHSCFLTGFWALLIASNKAERF